MLHISLAMYLITTSLYHYNDVIMSMMASQITSLTIVYSTVYSGPDQRKHESSASLASVWGIHRWLVNSPHKGPVMRKMFPFDDIIMILLWLATDQCYPYFAGSLITKKTKKSLDHVWFIMGIPMPISWCLFSEERPSVTSLTLGQPYYWVSVSEINLKNMGK